MSSYCLVLLFCLREGNHGAAVIFGLLKLGLKGQVFLPENAAKVKVENLKRMIGDKTDLLQLSFFGRDCLEAEIQARKVANEKGLVYISPYNDVGVMAGQVDNLQQQTKKKKREQRMRISFCNNIGRRLLSNFGVLLFFLYE